MSADEFTGTLGGNEVTSPEYVISSGVIEPGSFFPDHFHKWEEQTFHVIADTLEATIRDDRVTLGPGDTVHGPRRRCGLRPQLLNRRSVSEEAHSAR